MDVSVSGTKKKISEKKNSRIVSNVLDIIHGTIDQRFGVSKKVNKASNIYIYSGSSISRHKGCYIITDEA